MKQVHSNINSAASTQAKLVETTLHLLFPPPQKNSLKMFPPRASSHTVVYHHSYRALFTYYTQTHIYIRSNKHQKLTELKLVSCFFRLLFAKGGKNQHSLKEQVANACI